jgi:hypothetical protein
MLRFLKHDRFNGGNFMFSNPTGRILVVAAGLALMAASAAAQGGITAPKQGQGGSIVKGAAGTNGSVGDNGLQHCDKPMAAMAVVEPQTEVLSYLWRYQLQSPVGLIRMMIQQSNCFIVVERGVGMQNMAQERNLAAAGQTRQNSNIGGGQMVAADFIMTPNVVFSEGNAGGIGGAVGGLLGGKGAAIAGGLKFKEAQTSMLVADTRSGVQVAAAEGSTKKADLRLGAGLFGGGGGAAGGGYGNIIAAAFMDNYNKVVTVVRNDPTLQRNVGTLAQEAAAGGATKAGAVFNEGDVIGPKIANVKLMAEPSDTAKALATLGRTDELVVIGAEKNGFINVQGPNGSGWIKIVLSEKR